MGFDDVMSRLEELGTEGGRVLSAKRGAGDNQFGVKMGDLRALAKEIKTSHDLGLQLWATGNTDAMLLAVLVMSPKDLSADDLDRMVGEFKYSWLADWFSSYILKAHPAKEQVRERWMTSKQPMASRMGWSLTADRVEKAPAGLDLPGLLDRIEAEMKDAHELPRWTMNMTLATIGIHNPALRERALAIGEKLGVYRDYPVSKGCTSPFAPIWIGEMVKRAAVTP